MNTAYFYRNAKNTQEYEKVLSNHIEYMQCLNFIIVKKILITNKQFELFAENLKADYNFISDNINLMKMDNNDIVHCIMIRSRKHNFALLVYSAGYNYARYVGKIWHEQN